MSLFEEAKNEQGFLKAGYYGMPGSGKTFTAAMLARGIAKLAKDPRPVFAIDTEKGFDYLVETFKKDGVALQVARTRAFVNLLEAMDEAEKNASVLIIDSVTHFWQELIKSYQREQKRPQLRLQDWAPIKAEWARFTERFLNSRLHVIVCGRAGDDYDYQQNEDSGKMEVYKAGTKMLAEKSLGYEPGLVVEMEKVNVGAFTRGKRNLINRAHILKDRFDLIDGQSFDEPTFETFLPHVKGLNFGVHTAISRANSGALFAKDGDNFYERKKQIEILREEIQGELTSAYPGQSADDKKIKTDLVFEAFKTRSWEALGERPPEDLKRGLEDIKRRIAAYKAAPAAAAPEPAKAKKEKTPVEAK